MTDLSVDFLYILDDAGKPVMEPSPNRWAEWRGKHSNRVAIDQIGAVTVSTVFRGVAGAEIIHGHTPLLWQTMIFGGPHNRHQTRYDSKDDALAGHASAVDMVKKH